MLMQGVEPIRWIKTLSGFLRIARGQQLGGHYIWLRLDVMISSNWIVAISRGSYYNLLVASAWQGLELPIPSEARGASVTSSSQATGSAWHLPVQRQEASRVRLKSRDARRAADSRRIADHQREQRHARDYQG